MVGRKEHNPLRKRYRLGFDIGGTFTDLVLVDLKTGDSWIGKTLTTPEDPSVGALEGIRRLLDDRGLGLVNLDLAIHGTTLVSNAIIERRGAKTGLLTTKGFRDILEIGTGRRYDMDDYFLEFPEPLIPRRFRLEVPERILFDGKVDSSIDMTCVEDRVSWCVREQIESIAVCLLHSYANPIHEIAIGDFLKTRFPDLTFTLSCELVPEVGEVERVSTTVANAYVQPVVRSYLRKLNGALCEGELDHNGLPRRERSGDGPSLYLMLSSGGTTSVSAAEAFPIQLVESGPAAGALAASFVCELTEVRTGLSFDMGGTTAKACLIRNMHPDTATDIEVARTSRFKRGSGIPLKVPVVDLIEIGAGGGSIAHLDELGLLKVGPESAGANPGPACYDRGGKQPTVTDANLALGYLDSRSFLGGEMPLNNELAHDAIQQCVAKPLGIDVVKAAWGIFEVVNENMADAARIHVAEKNQDPRNLTLIAFGGAGPIHACAVARKLRAPRVIVPLAAGAASALGLLIAPPAVDLVQSYVTTLSDVDWRRVSEIFKGLKAKAAVALNNMGVNRDQISFEHFADCRYVGQLHQIRVSLTKSILSARNQSRFEEAFSSRYEQLYNFVNPEFEIEILSWRVRAVGPRQKVHLSPSARHTNTATIIGQRQVFFGDVESFVPCKVYQHQDLLAGTAFPGPAIIEERESTTVVGHGDRVLVDGWLNLQIELRPGPDKPSV